MANYSTLKAAVADVVKTNGTRAITGANLQSVLLSIINSVGGGGYIFKGVATPSTDAGTPDENVFYIGGAGTYANFGTSVTVPVGAIGIFKYNGSWSNSWIRIVMRRELATVLFCSDINFDNVNKKVDINSLLIADPASSSSRKTIAATSVPYTFSDADSTAQILVYDLNDESYKFLLTGFNNEKQIVVAGLVISGRPSQNDQKVVKVTYCPIENCYVDGESTTGDFIKLRGSCRSVFSDTINFDNANHRVVMSEVVVCDPTNMNRKTISATNVSYDFNTATTSAYNFVYDFTDSSYKFVYAGRNNINQLPIANVRISGNSSATPNTSKVEKILWCAIADYKLDGQNLATDFAKLRGAVRSAWCDFINFDNDNHKIDLNNVLIANPANAQRLTIQATSVQYNFNESNTTAYCFVYDCSDSSYKFVSAGTATINQVPIANLKISGNSSATPNTSKVVDIEWCAIENYNIDGTNIFDQVENIESQIVLQSSRQSFYLEKGNINNGTQASDGGCLRMADYYPVVGGSVLYLFHAADINIRVTEYRTQQAGRTLFTKQTGYGKFEKVILDSRTNLVRISASYAERGYSDSNPVDTTDFQDGDFGVVKQTTCLSGILSTPLIINYMDLGIFVDSSTWRIPTNSLDYRVRVIPVTGGGKIVCKANSREATRIAFLNTFDEATIRANAPVAVDGTGNQNTLAGQTRIYDIPTTCTYIALNSYYGGTSLPESLIIDGVEYMKTLQDGGINGQDEELRLEVANIEQGLFTSILGRNIQMDAAVRATGTKAVTADIKPLSLIHVSDIHTKSDNYKCFQNACEFYEHYSNFAAMIVTGDIVWDDFRNGTEWYDEALESTTKPVLNVIGNHDAGQWHVDLSSVSTDKQCYDRFIAPYVSGWGVTQPTGAATNGNSYYYKDFTDEKVRLIVLCEFETDYQIDPNDPTKLLYSREFRAMRQAQVTWFINTLTNTPADYGVVVSLHQPLGYLAPADNEFVSFDLVNNGNTFSVYSTDKEWLAKIVNAYATKSSLSLSVSQTGAVVTTLDCSCDFTSVQSEFICVLCGHTHRDYVGTLTNYPAIPILCVGADNLLYTSTFQPRALGTPSEDLFNVINIDRNRRTIKVIRIGSNASVTGQVRDQMILNY